MRDKKISKSFCVLPWIHRFTNLGGEIQVCCTSEEFDNSIKDVDGRPLLAPHDLDDKKIMNSPTLKKIRKQMEKGEWPDLCQRCLLTEKNGARSRRQSENMKYEKLIPQLLTSTKKDGQIPVQIISSDFRLGNQCNLACRMCHPRASTRWLQDYKKNPKLFAFSEDEIQSFTKYRWHLDLRFLPYFKEQLKSIQHLHFAGGEPLLSKAMIQMLSLCVENQVSKNIEVSYNTNLTVIPSAIKKLWPEFKSIKLLVSIDGFGKLNDYIRYPSRWSDIDKNLKDLEHNHALYRVDEVQIMTTFQIYNVFGLDELYDYLQKNFNFVNQLPHLIPLYFPHAYQSHALPSQLKSSAIRKLQSLKKRSLKHIQMGHIPIHQKYLIDTLEGCIQFTKSKSQNFLFQQFLSMAKAKDKIRKQSLNKVCPELSFFSSKRKVKAD